MRVYVDEHVCAGHARCNAVAGELFELDDIGFALPIDREIAPAKAGAAQMAANACPEGAITVEENL